MKKFLKKIGQFALRNLIMMVCLILLGVWIFPTNYNSASYKQAASETSNGDYGNYFSHRNSLTMDSVKSEAPRNLGGMVNFEKAINVSNTAEALVPNEQRKIIKNASLQIQVDDTEIARGLVEEKIKELKGLIINMNSHEVRKGVLAYNMTLRVPSDKLDQAVENIASLGVKKRESFSSNDITAQYMDTANLIKNLEARRDRLRDFMKMKTDKLSDVLEIDRELSRVQNQIDNYERTQKRRDLDVAYSTINLNIQAKPQIGDFSSPEEWNLETTWKSSVNDLIHSLQNIAEKAVRIAVYAPIWLPILIVLWLIQRRFRRKEKQSEKVAKK